MVHFIAVSSLEACALNLAEYGLDYDACFDLSQLIPATLIPR